MTGRSIDADDPEPLDPEPLDRHAEPYSRLGLSASQLEAILTSQADALAGEVAAVAYAGRGAVLWHDSEIRLLGPVSEEFKRAIAALLEDVPMESGRQVRDAILSMGGARLVVDRLIAVDGARPDVRFST